jgi:hypothetical protein
MQFNEELTQSENEFITSHIQNIKKTKISQPSITQDFHRSIETAKVRRNARRMTSILMISVILSLLMLCTTSWIFFTTAMKTSTTIPSVTQLSKNVPIHSPLEIPNGLTLYFIMFLLSILIATTIGFSLLIVSGFMEKFIHDTKQTLNGKLSIL